MLNDAFINPTRIAVVGGSDHLEKPGGKLLYNLLQKEFRGEIIVINPKQEEVQGVKSFHKAEDIKKEVDLAILAIPAQFCLASMRDLFRSCKTRSFIIVSAGFSEMGHDGELVEQELYQYAIEHDIQVLGPNCTGIFTPFYAGAFTTPIPEYDNWGVDLISASGATAVFLMEQGIRQGLRFKHVFSVGNALMITAEDILEYLDSAYSHKNRKVIILYLETIKDPVKLYTHACSLNRKGCKIVALKAGKTHAGSKAAASHTGAISNPYDAVQSLFNKAGIVGCQSRDQLINAALVGRSEPLEGNNIAIITHAGGPGVLAADALEEAHFFSSPSL